LKIHAKLWEQVFDGDPNRIVMHNIDYFTFLAVIQYLYTDVLKCAPHYIDKVYAAATKFNIPRLAAFCLKSKQKDPNTDVGKIDIPASSFILELQKAINNPEYSDIQFSLTDNTIIHSHKAILSQRSEYFSTIFSSSFVESGQKIIDIKEVDKDTFLPLLKFIYTSEYDIYYDKIVLILIAASRFLLDEMKQRIELTLEGDISKDNVLELLMFADSADTPKLKKSCVSFVVENLDEMKKCSNYNDLRENPALFRHIDYIHKKKNETVDYKFDAIVSF